MREAISFSLVRQILGLHLEFVSMFVNVNMFFCPDVLGVLSACDLNVQVLANVEIMRPIRLTYLLLDCLSVREPLIFCLFWDAIPRFIISAACFFSLEVCVFAVGKMEERARWTKGPGSAVL